MGIFFIEMTLHVKSPPSVGSFHMRFRGSASTRKQGRLKAVQGNSFRVAPQTGNSGVVPKPTGDVKPCRITGYAAQKISRQYCEPASVAR